MKFTIYGYNEKNEYIGEEITYESPVEKGKPFMGRNTTVIKPPTFDVNNEECIFDTKTNNWKIVAKEVPIVPEETFEESKRIKLNKERENYKNSYVYGYIVSVVGFKVPIFSIHKVENLAHLYLCKNVMTRKNLATVDILDFDGVVRTINLNEVNTIIAELEDFTFESNNKFGDNVHKIFKCKNKTELNKVKN